MTGALAWLAMRLSAVVVVSATLPQCTSDVVQFVDLFETSLLAAASEAQTYLPIGRCDCILDETTEETPLHRLLNSVSHGSAPVGALAVLIEALLGKHADLLAQDSDGATPLHVAAFHGEVVSVATLCQAAARSYRHWEILNAPDAEGHTPLGRALRAWKVPAARILSQSGADAPNSTRALHCDPDLLDAVLRSQLGNLQDAKATASVDCLVPPNPGRNSTLLHLAALLSEEGEEEAIDVVRLLLASGAKAARPDALGETPLMSAVRTDQVEVVQLMLDELGPEAMNAKNRQGQTALHLSAIAGSSRSLRLLVIQGASVDIKDAYGRTPAYYAEQRGETEAVRFIDQGAVYAEAAATGDQPGGNHTAFKSSGKWTQEDELAADLEDATGFGTDALAAAIVGAACGCICIAFCMLLLRRRCRRKVAVAPAKTEEKPLKRGGSSVDPRRSRPVWVQQQEPVAKQALPSGRISPRPMSDSDVSEVGGAGKSRKNPTVVVHANPRTPKSQGGSLTIPTAFSETGASTRASTAETKSHGDEPKAKKAAKAKAGPRTAANKADNPSAPTTSRPKGKAKAKAKRG